MGYVHGSQVRRGRGTWRRTTGFALATVLTLAALSGACASGGGKPRPFPVPGGAGTAVPAPRLARDVVESALALVGTPYRNGGGDLSGFDCSGLVQFVFATHRIVLPRSVSAQFQAGRTIEFDRLRAGDLLFFSTTGPGATHVGIAMGDGRFVHAPSSRGTVRVETLTGGYWLPRVVGVRRVIDP